MARQNKSPRFVVALRSGSLPLAIATAPEQNLLELLRVNLQKEVYTSLQFVPDSVAAGGGVTSGAVVVVLDGAGVPNVVPVTASKFTVPGALKVDSCVDAGLNV